MQGLGAHVDTNEHAEEFWLTSWTCARAGATAGTDVLRACAEHSWLTNTRLPSGHVPVSVRLEHEVRPFC